MDYGSLLNRLVYYMSDKTLEILTVALMSAVGIGVLVYTTMYM